MCSCKKNGLPCVTEEDWYDVEEDVDDRNLFETFN